MKIFPKIYGQVLIFLTFYLLCVYIQMRVCVYMTTCYTHGEKPCESVLSFYHAGPGDWAHIIPLGIKHLHTLTISLVRVVRFC